jgi:hypothetical protein
MSSRIAFIQVVIALGVAPALGGCMMTTMRTADRLEAGEVVGSFSGDVALMSLRGTGQVLVGTGFGDVGAHLGLGFPTSLGLSGRLYLGDWFNLGAQAEYNAMWEMFGGALQLTTALPHIEKPGDGGLYGGLSYFAAGSPDWGWAEANLGLIGGFEFRLSRGVNIQLEVVAYPGCSDIDCATGPFQVSLGFNASGARTLREAAHALSR